MNAESTPELDKQCEKCRGHGGRRHDEGFWIECEKCNGTGYIPTALGKEVLRFLSVHLAAQDN